MLPVCLSIARPPKRWFVCAKRLRAGESAVLVRGAGSGVFCRGGVERVVQSIV